MARIPRHGTAQGASRSYELRLTQPAVLQLATGRAYYSRLQPATASLDSLLYCYSLPLPALTLSPSQRRDSDLSPSVP